MRTPTLLWDIGTAYDMFISLDVLHNPDKFGLRGAWAAGVRSRLPAAERDALQTIVATINWPLHWIYTLPAPKNGDVVIQTLATMPAQDRLEIFIQSPFTPADSRELMRAVAARGAWNEEDLRQIQIGYQAHWGAKLPPKEIKEKAVNMLNLCALGAEFGEGLLAGLRVYQEVFFAEEETRIRPALESALLRAQNLAATLELPELIEALSQGVRLTEEMEVAELILAPSFWVDPLLIMGKIDEGRAIFLFGGRPDDASLVPGAMVPDVLFQTLKALADPTRLRILRYLSEEPLTPAELARRLRLRPPTVVHHLHALRLARLVHLTLEHEGKQYQARREAIDEAFALLTLYLDKGLTDD
ncbi:MAG: winged helix-turn-helix transcriptional regulator [Chloroflexi bacterium]|nr:winged helix-turn-helix transcriptional regulator [Chloroflexota bacterium]